MGDPPLSLSTFSWQSQHRYDAIQPAMVGLAFDAIQRHWRAIMAQVQVDDNEHSS
jgi:hypothetical protein